MLLDPVRILLFVFNTRRVHICQPPAATEPGGGEPHLQPGVSPHCRLRAQSAAAAAPAPAARQPPHLAHQPARGAGTAGGDGRALRHGPCVRIAQPLEPPLARRGWELSRALFASGQVLNIPASGQVLNIPVSGQVLNIPASGQVLKKT